MENKSLNNGHIIEITPDMFDQAANDFSEGNENLKKLLMFCFENGIKTAGCCSGHNGEKTPYIQLEFSDRNIPAILKVLKKFPLSESISNLLLRSQPGVTSNLCILMQNNKYNEGFEELLETLANKEQIELNELDETNQLIVKSIQNHSIPNSYLEIQEEKENVSIIVTDDYLHVFSTEALPKAWIDGTHLVEYAKDSKELNDALKILESNTKNYTYLTKHPYDEGKIKEFWQNRDNLKSTIEGYPDTTLGRQRKYREKNVIVVKPSLGSSLEAFANEIMEVSQYGQACVTMFNDFSIDTRDYDSPSEIVQAYMQRVEKARAQRNNFTIDEVRDAVSDVKISDINNEIKKIKQEIMEKQPPEIELE